MSCKPNNVACTLSFDTDAPLLAIEAKMLNHGENHTLAPSIGKHNSKSHLLSMNVRFQVEEIDSILPDRKEGAQSTSPPRESQTPRQALGPRGKLFTLSDKTQKSGPPEEDSKALRLIKQLETQPICQEQLVAEVKGIYAALVIVETKCINVDNAQSSQNNTKLNNEQWQALIALHRTLLHKHHNFFLASQHPSASQALKRLASKYAMPAQMWQHSIHSFLKLLRHRLPGSLEHMLTFIYLANSMIALLYKTVPAFEDTWIECLGDLGKYRIAIKNEDIRNREVWTSVSRHYSAKKSIITLFDPILGVGNYQHSRLIPIDVAFVKIHGILFSQKQLDSFRPVASEFLRSLDNHIGRIAKRWIEAGYCIAIANCCALLSYGKENNVIMRSIHSQSDKNQNQSIRPRTNISKPSKDFEDALYLAMGTHKVVFHRQDNANVLPYTHVVIHQLKHLFPWKLLELMLNGLLDSYDNYNRIRSNKFPRESNNLPRPVPEDFALESLLFVNGYYPSDWFSNNKIDNDKKYFEMPSITNVRKERILWLGHKIAQSGKELTYNEDTNQFGVLPQYEKEIEEISKDADMNISDSPDIGSQTIPTGAGDAMDVDGD
ncbi:hypothetical protein GGR55DRAFT_689252 [Xylaria sp. FL0064]|nr:hypothetical protein GGR55DRAFT_689252 [Xylaria sp. FL0064]